MFGSGYVEDCLNKEIEELQSQKRKALEIIFDYSQIDGSHHKAWVIDQVARVLLGDKYEEAIEEYMYYDKDECYDWDEGIAP